jgi:hypothetical protein
VLFFAFFGGVFLQVSPLWRDCFCVFLALGIAPTAVADGAVTIGHLIAAGKSKFSAGHPGIKKKAGPPRAPAQLLVSS